MELRRIVIYPLYTLHKYYVQSYSVHKRWVGLHTLKKSHRTAQCVHIIMYLQYVLLVFEIEFSCYLKYIVCQLPFQLKKQLYVVHAVKQSEL